MLGHFPPYGLFFLKASLTCSYLPLTNAMMCDVITLFKIYFYFRPSYNKSLFSINPNFQTVFDLLIFNWAFLIKFTYILMEIFTHRQMRQMMAWHVKWRKTKHLINKYNARFVTFVLVSVLYVAVASREGNGKLFWGLWEYTLLIPRNFDYLKSLNSRNVDENYD